MQACARSSSPACDDVITYYHAKTDRERDRQTDRQTTHTHTHTHIQTHKQTNTRACMQVGPRGQSISNGTSRVPLSVCIGFCVCRCVSMTVCASIAAPLPTPMCKHVRISKLHWGRDCVILVRPCTLSSSPWMRLPTAKPEPAPLVHLHTLCVSVCTLCRYMPMLSVCVCICAHTMYA
jgi:hypothetical protein